MQKTLLILSMVLFTVALFGQTSSKAVSAIDEKAKVEKPAPYYGVYEDLDDMKARFNAYVSLQKKEKAIAEMPNDETLWESAKGPQDFDGPKMVSTYGMQRPTGYAAKVEKEKVDKETLGNNIKASLILSKKPTHEPQEDWELKLKKN